MRRTTIIPNKRRPWFHSPILAVFLVILILWGSFVVYKIHAKHREAVLLRDQYRNELVELQKKEVELDAKIKDLSTDRGMEAEVRNRYRMVRPGEQLVIVVDDGSPTTSGQPAEHA
ncbi:MAG: septum formation initiator family protein [Proteobacteria bacterium]|nr:septum formation initiator family protein [Pseudomonadota bacterium]